MHLRDLLDPLQRSFMSDRHTRDNRREGDFSDKRDRKYGGEVKDTRDSSNPLNNRNRSRSPPVSRTKSPSRWDDPLKQFSEVKTVVILIN